MNLRYSYKDIEHHINLLVLLRNMGIKEADPECWYLWDQYMYKLGEAIATS